MARNSNKSNQMAKDKDFIKDYILYDLIIKEENYNLKSLMTNLELNLKKIFKSVTIDPHKFRILCKLNKIDDSKKYDKDLDMKDVFLVPIKYSDEDLELNTSYMKDEYLNMIVMKFPDKPIENFFQETFGLELLIDESKKKKSVSGVNFQIKLMYKFMIELKKEFEMSDSPKKSIENSPINANTSKKNHDSIIINNVKIIVYRESITNLKVDAIVNSIDDQITFQNRMGLCKAVYEKFGPNIELECKRVANITLQRHPISGDCIIVRSGMTKPSFIINAVSPKPDEKNMKKILELTFNNILNMAHSNPRIKNIAIPLLTTGVYGMDKSLCSKILFESIINLSNLDLEEIHLVNIDSESTKALINELNNISRTKNNNNFHQRNNNQNECQNENLLAKESKKLEKNQNKNKKENDKMIKNELFNFHKSADDFTRICDICGQRIRIYMKLYKCDHVYCMGCKIDYENNQKSCFLSHDKTESECNQNNDKYDEGELIESINKMEINDSNDAININDVISDKNETKDNLCEICFASNKEIKLNKCDHSLCKNCYETIMKTIPKCPFCQTIYGILTGSQPKNGRMTHILISTNLAGYPNVNTIQISYVIPNGIQGSDHPNPGRPYNGISRIAYLPNNKEGNYILGLFYKAFENGLTFTIGNSRTTNAEGVITWNDIHHKTKIDGQYGYPDPDYLNRVKMELKERGIE